MAERSGRNGRATRREMNGAERLNPPVIFAFFLPRVMSEAMEMPKSRP